jgi:2-dehydropantoate 2-reductase
VRVLFYGAGVIGSLYAARLCNLGHDVTVLARGARLEELRRSGLVLQRASGGAPEIAHVRLVERLAPEDDYDLVIVAVRRNQVDSVLPVLGANHRIVRVLFMVNNALGYAPWISALGRERVLVGFPGAGGTIADGVVQYSVLSRLVQATTIGEAAGPVRTATRDLARELDRAGFPTAVSRDMDAWQKTHVALVSPIANALYLSGGDHVLLSRSREVLGLLVDAVREGFAVVRALGKRVEPARLSLVDRVPRAALVAALARWTRSNHFELVAGRHARAARDEMSELAAELRMLACSTAVATPAMDRLAGSMRALS